jgi:hypothetical protein
MLANREGTNGSRLDLLGERLRASARASDPGRYFTVPMQTGPTLGRDKVSLQIRRAKIDSLFELARSSIVACCSLCGACGAAAAEERQAAPNYNDLIHSAVKTSFIDPSSVGLVEISPFRPTRGPQMGDRMACLRIAINGQPTFYAVFIDSQLPKVILLRLAVRFDDCARDQYEPLIAAPPAQDRPVGPPRKK